MGADTSLVKGKNGRNSMDKTTKGKGYRLGCRPGQKDPRTQASDRAWIEKLATGKNRGESNSVKWTKEELSVGTWNVRTLWQTGKLELLRKEMERYRCDILGLAEMRWTGIGEMNGGEVLWSGEEKEHKRGVGFLLSEKAKRALLGYKPVSPRIIVARFGGQPINLTVIQVYAPTSDSSDEELDKFYFDLEESLKDVPRKDMKMIVGDWNAKVGMDCTGWEGVIGRYGYGERNERGEKLLEFASKYNMTICNTRFQQKDCRKYTWVTPDGKHQNMIDLVLIERRWKTSVRLCRSFQGADIVSDHSLVISNIKLKFRQTPKRQYKKRRDIGSLKIKNIKDKYERSVSRRIRQTDMKGSNMDEKVKTINAILMDAVEEVVPTVERPRREWISDTTLVLAKEKRKAKENRNVSEELNRKY